MRTGRTVSISNSAIGTQRQDMITSQQIPTIQPGGRVLVVDDEEKNRRLLCDLLSSQGFTCRTANNGTEALQLATEFRPETILLDIMMPGIDGVEVCRRLKTDAATSSIPVLLATALHERADRMSGLEAGANDFLSKPLNTEEVSLRVKNAVHLKRLHDRLQGALSELQKLETLRDSLVHMIVHDLRSPLAVISMTLDIIMPEINRLSPEKRKLTAAALNSSQGLIEMVSSLLDVSRMEAGQMPLARTVCDLKDIARAATDSMNVAAGQKDLHFAVSGGTALCSVDPEIVRRVFINLLANAVRFSPTGETVAVDVSPTGQGFRCSIADRGQGIPPEYHQRIFEKFGQVESGRAAKMYSTGLGLTFCKLAVEAHGGKIGVISEIGKGSTFWFELPA